MNKIEEYMYYGTQEDRYVENMMYEKYMSAYNKILIFLKHPFNLNSFIRGLEQACEQNEEWALLFTEAAGFDDMEKASFIHDTKKMRTLLRNDRQ